MELVLTPNLPKRAVCVAVSAEDIPGVQCIKPPKQSVLPLSMQQHADLQLCHLGENVLLSSPETYTYYKERLSSFGFEILCGETNIGSTYPHDAAYNIARVGNVAFHNPQITDPVALKYFQENDILLVPVKQGYAKCAVLPLDAHTIVTQDSGIAKAAARTGITVLQIVPGGVSLPGFSYGFLGGAGGKLAEDLVFITGKLSLHQDYKKIITFFAERGIKIREGSIPNPVDIGSVLPLVMA